MFFFNTIGLYWHENSKNYHRLRMVIALSVIHQLDRVMRKTSNASAAVCRYQTHVKYYCSNCALTAFLKAGNPCETPQFIWQINFFVRGCLQNPFATMNGFRMLLCPKEYRFSSIFIDLYWCCGVKHYCREKLLTFVPTNTVSLSNKSKNTSRFFPLCVNMDKNSCNHCYFGSTADWNKSWLY